MIVPVLPGSRIALLIERVCQFRYPGFTVCSLVLMDDALGDGLVEQAACRLCLLMCSCAVSGFNSVANGTCHGLQFALYRAIAHARLLVGLVTFLLTLDICHFFVPFGFLRHPSQWGFGKHRSIHCAPSCGQFAPALPVLTAPLLQVVPPFARTDLEQTDPQSVTQAILRHFP